MSQKNDVVKTGKPRKPKNTKHRVSVGPQGAENDGVSENTENTENDGVSENPQGAENDGVSENTENPVSENLPEISERNLEWKCLTCGITALFAPATACR